MLKVHAVKCYMDFFVCQTLETHVMIVVRYTNVLVN